MTLDFDWPARPTLTTLEDDPGHRSIAADYEIAEAKADFWSDFFLFACIFIGFTVYAGIGVLGIWKLLDLIGVSL